LLAGRTSHSGSSWSGDRDLRRWGLKLAERYQEQKDGNEKDGQEGSQEKVRYEEREQEGC
jgi:hypothetical protein